MRKPFGLILAVFALAFGAGCVNTELTADIDPSADVTALQTFYVVKSAEDDRGIESIIAAELESMGKTAASGVAPKPPSPVDAVVTYQDKWMWDITMYMLELNIDFRDPTTNYKFATGRSFRTSLARQKPEEMAAEVLKKMFGVEPVGGEK